ncbi:MAG TPA: dihydrofolate reductase family protein [Streptosporangiaceae bacterium]|nr:dihydrofolate reductase family protein [Streptosporangiaceae bacterium]
MSEEHGNGKDRHQLKRHTRWSSPGPGRRGRLRTGWLVPPVRRSQGPRGLVARETAEALGAEALLLGRRSSEWFASRMLARDGADVRVSREWADRVKSIPKYVVASALEDPQWSNAAVLSGDAVKEISELKQKADGEILVYGSYQLVRLLIEQNLADELRLVVFPVVLGTGLRIFGETSDKKPLHLVSTRKIGDGLVFCTYEFVQG